MPVSYRVCRLPACLLEKYCVAVCGWVCVFSEFMDEEFEAFVFAENCGVEEIIMCCLSLTYGY